MELVGIEPLQWIENIQLADSTMFSKGKKSTNSNSAQLKNPGENPSATARRAKIAGMRQIEPEVEFQRVREERRLAFGAVAKARSRGGVQD